MYFFVRYFSIFLFDVHLQKHIKLFKATQYLFIGSLNIWYLLLSLNEMDRLARVFGSNPF